MEIRQGWNRDNGCLLTGTALPRESGLRIRSRSCLLTSPRDGDLMPISSELVVNKRSFIWFESLRPVTTVIKSCLHRFVPVIQPRRWRSTLRCTNPAASIHHAGNDVKKVFSSRSLMGVLLSGTLVLAGCGAPPPKDFGGSWKPVNRFPASTTVIPLNQQYEFFASPMDGTLKTMLQRWAKDSGRTLSYRLTDDYTLTTQASQIHSLDIHVAAGQLNSIYATQGVLITVSDRQIDVGVAPASAVTNSDSGKVTSTATKPSASP
jgi:hypothetical protein